MEITQVDWPRLYKAFEAGKVDPTMGERDHAERLRHILMRRRSEPLKHDGEKIKAIAKPDNTIDVQLRLAGQWYHFFTF